MFVFKFCIFQVIGRGSYAKVLMVELKSTKRIYAMKVSNYYFTASFWLGYE